MHNPNLLNNARRLRRGQTKEEKKLWYQFLSKLPVKFLRQRIVQQYIVDFYCASAKLIIEVDGAQHYEDDAISYDRIRDEYLRGLGYTVLRYTNKQVNQSFRVVCEDIWNHLGIE